MDIHSIARTRLTAFMVTCLCTLMLAACGGGGGDSSPGRTPGQNSNPSPNPDPSPNPAPNSQPGDFTLSSASVAVTAKLGTFAPIATIGVQLNDTLPAAVVAGYPPGVERPSWLEIRRVGSGPNVTFELVAIPLSPRQPATLATTIAIATVDSEGDPLVTKLVPVTLTLREGVFAYASGSLIEATFGSPVQEFSRSVFVSAPSSISWQAVTDVPWLRFTGSAQAQGQAPINMSIDTSTLAVGTHPVRVTVTNVSDPTDRSTATFTVRVQAPVLSLTTPALLLGGPSGLGERSASIGFSIDTGTNVYPWTATATTSDAGGNWLKIDLTNGTVGATQQSIVLDVDAASLSRGTYSGNLALQVMVNGLPLSANVPVTLNLDSNRLVISATGVAFSSVPGREVLTRRLTLANSLDLPDLSWRAQSDQPWLRVTPAGTGALTLTADPTGLAPGQYLANVDVTPDSANVVNAQSVRVGLYVSDSAPAARVDVPVTNAIITASNPVLPEFYTLEGTTVRAYDVYSGALLRTVATVTGVPQSMTLSDDGRVIYVMTDSYNVDGHVFAIDPENGGVLNTWLFPSLGFQQGGGRNAVQYMRPEGHPVLFAGPYGQYLDIATGEVRRSAGADLASSSAVSADQRYLYLSVPQISPSSTYLQELRYSTLLSEGLIGRRLAQNNGFRNPGYRGSCRDTAVSVDGSRLYIACGDWLEYLDPRTLENAGRLSGDASGNVEISWNGLIAATNSLLAPVNANLWVYDAAGVQLALLGAGGTWIYERTLRFSGDGTRLLSTTETGMRIQAAP